MNTKSLIVVAGPTAVGKTGVAILLAKHFDTVVVSADSRQIYREMNIGTAKPTQEERDAVPHYFVDTHSVADRYDAAAYADDALALIADLFTTRNEVILCGGSGLYIRAVCEGFDDIPAVPDAIRDELVRNYNEHGIGWLREELRRRDPDGLAAIDPDNPHRLIRALEVHIHTGESILSFRKNRRREHPFQIIKIGLDLPREELYARIDERMDRMIAAGLFEEAKTLHPHRHLNALQTVGYQEIFDYIDNRYDREECVRLLKRNSRRYAKRQLTWFRKDPGFTWFHPDDIDGIIRHIRSQQIRND